MTAAVCHYLDLSKELGGLLAGFAPASTPQHNLIAARLAPLRDFLLLFFFVGLGSQIEISTLGAQIIPAVILSVFVLLGKPLIIMTIMGYMGYRKRTSFMAGMTLGQISEFSLIFAAMALSAGLMDENMVAMITLTGLITIGLSTYAILNTDRLHDLAERHIDFFERKKPRHKEDLEDTQFKKRYDIIIFGLGRYGTSIAREFEKKGHSVRGVDFDPQAIKFAEINGIPALYGDASDPELPPHLPLENAHTVVFAFQHHAAGPLIADLRLTLAKILREHGYTGHIVSTSHFKTEEKTLVHHGVDIVICPFEDAAVRGAEQVIHIIGTGDK
jgi:voltage-gated potassium channel Kch